jgi:ADP-heptose:LPS heptosyltransferase
MRLPVKYVLRKGAMGDVLWIEPLIKSLAASYKRVVVVSKYIELFDNYPLKNVTFVSELSLTAKIFYGLEKLFKVQYFFINLRDSYERNPTVHLLLAYFAKAKESATFIYPSLYLSDAEKSKKISAYSKYAVIHLDKYPDKQNFRNVHGIDWQDVASRIRGLGYDVVQIGKREHRLNGVEFLDTSLRDLIALINNCAFFIGPDSGPSHLAACLQKPAIIMFGSVDPWLRHIKHQFNGFIMQGHCELAGCYHRQPVREQICLIEGNGTEGPPKCSVHSTEEINRYIASLVDLARERAKTGAADEVNC